MSRISQVDLAREDFSDCISAFDFAHYKTITACVQELVRHIDSVPCLSAIALGLPPADAIKWIEEMKSTRGSSAGSCAIVWPASRDESLSVRLSILRHLTDPRNDVIDFTSLFFPDSQFEVLVDRFIDTFVRPFAIAFLKRLDRHARESQEYTNIPPRSSHSPAATTIKVFISHASRDAEYATKLVKLLRQALRLASSDIRCTSVAGYKLPAGASVSESLRRDIDASAVLIALISTSSIQSVYSLFEMGARWGTARPLIPLLHPQFSVDGLPSPLDSLNALSGSVENDVHQLVSDTAKHLGIAAEPPESYADDLRALADIRHLDITQSTPPTLIESPPPGRRATLNEKAEYVLSCMCKNNGRGQMFRNNLGESVLMAGSAEVFRSSDRRAIAKVESHIESLVARHFVEHGVSLGIDFYSVTTAGYDYCDTLEGKIYTLGQSGTVLP